MVDFWEKRFDVLVCTTIVESGLDVSNANTMIIERADTLGLSQLHQLRGRVGRGRERAYAYFLYPPEKPLTETAHDRLATIAQHSELGGGMAVAMKDLEIRGAGNLLGGEQSGHIADVGFDLYVRLVGEAVAEFRGEASPSARSRSSCRSRRTCRTTTCRASGCGWRCTSAWPTSAPPTTSTSCGPSWSTATASRPRRSRSCSTSPGCASECARPGSARSPRPARTSGSPASSCRSRPRCGCSGSTPEHLQAGRADRAGAASQDGAGRRHAAARSRAARVDPHRRRHPRPTGLMAVPPWVGLAP